MHIYYKRVYVIFLVHKTFQNYLTNNYSDKIMKEREIERERTRKERERETPDTKIM